MLLIKLANDLLLSMEKKDFSLEKVPNVLKNKIFSAFENIRNLFHHTGRSMVVGHVPMVYMCSFLCICHIDMKEHTPAL